MEVEKMNVFSKWISIMPNKIITQFKRVYIANVNSIQQFNQISSLFKEKELIINDMLFDSQYITKSSYIFDVVLFFDVGHNITRELLTELKESVMHDKGQIWILCDNKTIDGMTKEQFMLKRLDTTNIRSSIVKYNEDFKTIVLK